MAATGTCAGSNKKELFVKNNYLYLFKHFKCPTTYSQLLFYAFYLEA